MLENFIFLVIFDTCDVMYRLSISLLPPIVLDNLFGRNVLFMKTSGATNSQIVMSHKKYLLFSCEVSSVKILKSIDLL